MDTKNNKSVKEILGLEELSPLETGEIRGGADKKKEQTQKKEQKETDEAPSNDDGLYV